MAIKVSIIVPVYNGGKFIEKCVKSLQRQTLTDIQIILVDDGSKDMSGVICDGLAAKDGRILALHKENGGVSSARNLGIQEARGEYLGFVDADDWIDKEMFEKLYLSAQNNEADIVMCDAVTEYESGKKELDTITQIPQNMILGKKDFYPELLMEMAGSACRCIYRTQQIHRYALEFNKALKFSEDRVFNIYAMGYVNKVVYLKEAFYHRLLESQSAVHRFHEDYYQAICNANIATEDALYDVWGGKKEYIRAYKRHYISGAISAINNYFYKTSTMRLSERLYAVRSICKDGQLCSAIKETGFGGKRGQWIVEGRTLLLIVGAYMSNLKSGR